MKKKITFACAVLSLFLLSACSSSSSDSSDEQLSGDCALKIINGSQCPGGKGPVALIRLYIGSELIGMCTGSFLTQTHVLTAAHCFSESHATAAEVWVGGESSTAKQWYVNPNYDSSADISPYDSAIIELNESLDVPTLPLLVSDAPEAGMTLNIIGFGQDEDGNSALDEDPADALKKAEVELAGVTSDPFLVTNFDDTDTGICQGDSGGPAIALNHDGIAGIIGIANAVGGQTLIEVEKCETNTSSIFTDIQLSGVQNWILSIVPDAGLI